MSNTVVYCPDSENTRINDSATEVEMFKKRSPKRSHTQACVPKEPRDVIYFYDSTTRDEEKENTGLGYKWIYVGLPICIRLYNRQGDQIHF